MNNADALTQRIRELEDEVALWKGLSADLQRQLLSARKQTKQHKPASETQGFDAFWSAWPSSHRKVNKKQCLARWLSAGLEAKSQQIVEHVKACASSADWTKNDGQFIPAPLVYLNQERYTAPAPAKATIKASGSLAGITYNNTGVDDDGYFY